jgi:ketosteroid isomerase-like protein
MSDSSQNLALARQYLKAIESGASSSEMAQFCHPEIIVEIFPSSFFPRGSRSDLDGIRAAAERGKKVMSSQTYEVTNALAVGDQVALEVLWTGTLLVPFQSIPVGSQMHAHFATFLRFRDSKIISQRNYDCYDPA